MGGEAADIFGYVFIDKPEMKIKDFAIFKCYYCGLCKTLKREYSEVSRLILNYDCAFLYVLAAALDESQPQMKKERCISSPVKKKFYAVDAGAEYAAAANVMLAVKKYDDDLRDDRSPLSWTLTHVYGHAYQKAKGRYPKMAEGIERGLKALYQLEAQRTDNVDAAAHEFANILGEIFAGLDQRQERSLRSMGYHIGRWIYLIDAYHDIERDLRKGQYNPYVERYGRDKARNKRKYIRDDVEFSLNVTMERGIQAYDLLDVEKNKAILDNIMYQGLLTKTKNILDGDGKETDGSIQGTGS